MFLFAIKTDTPLRSLISVFDLDTNLIQAEVDAYVG